MAVDHQVQQMMEELSRALARAIRTSSDVSQAIRKIRHRGLSPHLLLSCERHAGVPSAARRGAEADIEISGRGDPPREPAGDPVAVEATFRLNGRDVALLKSMGIDPTRRGRARRRRGRGRRRREPRGAAERRDT
jgi:hypothetical protein